CANVHLDATEHGRELIFLHRVKAGPADQSCRLSVAELAGAPRVVIDEARDYLSRLAQYQHALAPPTPQRELDLAPAPARKPVDRRDERAHEVVERLRTLDVDSLSPRAALDLLYELAAQAKSD